MSLNIDTETPLLITAPEYTPQDQQQSTMPRKMRHGVNVEPVELDLSDVENPYIYRNTKYKRFNSGWGELIRHNRGRGRRINYIATTTMPEEESLSSAIPLIPNTYTRTSAAARKRRLTELKEKYGSYAAHKWRRSLQAELLGVGEYQFVFEDDDDEPFRRWCDKCVHLPMPCSMDCRGKRWKGKGAYIEHEKNPNVESTVDQLCGENDLDSMMMATRYMMHQWAYAGPSDWRKDPSVRHSSSFEDVTHEDEAPTIQGTFGPIDTPSESTPTPPPSPFPSSGSLDGDWDPWHRVPLRVTNPDIKSDSEADPKPRSIPPTPNIQPTHTSTPVGESQEQLHPEPSTLELNENPPESVRQEPTETPKGDAPSSDFNDDLWYTATEMLKMQEAERSQERQVQQHSNEQQQQAQQISNEKLAKAMMKENPSSLEWIMLFYNPMQMVQGREGYVDEMERDFLEDFKMRRGKLERRLQLEENKEFAKGSGTVEDENEEKKEDKAGQNEEGKAKGNQEDKGESTARQEEEIVSPGNAERGRRYQAYVEDAEDEDESVEDKIGVVLYGPFPEPSPLFDH